jgi:hypothetical protein
VDESRPAPVKLGEVDKGEAQRQLVVALKARMPERLLAAAEKGGGMPLLTRT